MRDHLDTSKQDDELANRKFKWSSKQSRTPEKIIKQRFDSDFVPGLDDVSMDISSICEVSDDNRAIESMEHPVGSYTRAVSPSVASATSDISLNNSALTSDSSPISPDLSPLSSTILYENVQANNAIVNCHTADSSDVVKGDSGKAELLAKRIRQAGTQRLNSNNMLLLSINVLEELLKIVVGVSHYLPESRDWFTDIIAKKVQNVLRKVFFIIITFMLLFIFVGIFVFSSGDESSYNELVPT